MWDYNSVVDDIASYFARNYPKLSYFLSWHFVHNNNAFLAAEALIIIIIVSLLSVSVYHLVYYIRKRLGVNRAERYKNYNNRCKKMIHHEDVSIDRLMYQPPTLARDKVFRSLRFFLAACLLYAYTFIVLLIVRSFQKWYITESGLAMFREIVAVLIGASVPIIALIIVSRIIKRIRSLCFSKGLRKRSKSRLIRIRKGD